MIVVEVHDLEMKTCRGCNEEKPVHEFYDREDMADGKNSQCRACLRKRFDSLDAKDPEKTRLAHKLRALRYLHKRMGSIEGDFTLNQVIGIWEAQGRKCLYCGVSLPMGDISLDHKQPTELGGTNHFFNLAAACETCNKTKGTMSEVEFRAYLNH
jgi:5-methylcytosine-specific restriction endonuclease McrA